MNTRISDGMKKMFVAQIGAICCTVIVFIPVVGWIAGGIGSIVFAILSLLGLWAIGQEVPECKKAFILTIVNALLSLLAGDSLPGKIVGVACEILSFLIVYLVCTSLAKVLREAGAADVANFADLVWKINLGCYIAAIVAIVLSWIPFFQVFAMALMWIGELFSVIAGVLYIIFLYKGYKALS